MSNLNIKELSKKIDIAQETLRRWEAKYSFLIVPRNQKGNRFYPPSIVEQFVKLKELKDQDKLDEEIIGFFGVVPPDPESPNLNLTSTQVNQNLKTALIEEIKTTLSNEIKVNNDMAFKLSGVSNELGFMRGQLKFTQDENQDLKNQLQYKLSEVGKLGFFEKLKFKYEKI